jgi:SAM-dependent methyltransferase
MYDPQQYWEERGKNFTNPEREDELVNLGDIIYSKREEINSILDVGSGDGRVYKFLRYPKIPRQIFVKKENYKMCDFVDSFRKKCELNTSILPDKWDGKTLPYADDTFDLVISFSVMLHVKPEDIDEFIKEHARVSKKYIFVATWHEDNFSGSGQSHCFHYNYFDIFEKLGLKVLESKSVYMEDGIYRRKNILLLKERS